MGYVYLATDGKLTKIGISQDADKRMKGLKRSHGHDATVIHRQAVPDEWLRDTEGELHNTFKGKRVTPDNMQRPREWFRLDADDTAQAVALLSDIAQANTLSAYQQGRERRRAETRRKTIRRLLDLE